MALILGSKSPRRKQLLEDMGFDFEIRTKDTDESFPADLAVEKIPEYIAKKKADALIDSISSEDILITSDTIVVLNKVVYGKPSDRADAIRILQELSGKTHQVITGFIVIHAGTIISKSVTTNVTFKPLSASEIDYYIDTFKPFDKAGSYGIQDWFGLVCITKIDGSYTNVVGLPTEEVYGVLKEIMR